MPVELLPEVTGELAVSIGNNCCGHSVVVKYIIEKLSSNICGGGSSGAGNKVSVLCKFIDKNGDGIMVAWCLG
jgi:hypothetical protein